MMAALTGGMGCGKSLVLEYFAKLGWFTLSADAICREIYTSHDTEFFAALKSHWGQKVFTAEGVADKATIAEIVFNDDAELEWLNSALHPLVMARGMIQSSQAGSKPVMFEVPLLFEARLEQNFSPVLCVWSNREVQMERLLRRGMTEKQIKQRLAKQLTADEKLERADYGLINNSDVGLLYQQCDIINDKLRK